MYIVNVDRRACGCAPAWAYGMCPAALRHPDVLHPLRAHANAPTYLAASSLMGCIPTLTMGARTSLSRYSMVADGLSWVPRLGGAWREVS